MNFEIMKKRMQIILSNLRPSNRPCPFLLYCDKAYDVNGEVRLNAYCWGGTGDRELFRRRCIRKAAKKFWKEEREMVTLKMREEEVK